MRQKFASVLCLLTLLTVPALADPLELASDDIKKSLTAPELTAEGAPLDRDDLNAFYKARDFRPAWNLTGDANAAALTIFLTSIGRLIDYHGLRREDYALDKLRTLAAAGDEQSRLTFELLASDTLLQFARELHGDNIDLNDLYPGWNFRRDKEDIPGEMAAAADARKIDELFDRLAPKNPAYGDLAAALVLYRNMATAGADQGGDWPKIDAGPTLKPGDRGKRITQLRARLAAESYLPDAPPGKGKDAAFGKDLAEALKQYQTRNGLDVDGHMGAKTLEALNIPLATRIDQIRANMERWRHMPEDFPPQRYALVNIPDQSVIIVENGQLVYKGPVIVGQVERKTPFIQSAIKSMIINPFWHVPKKIAREDILPKLREDPHYLEKLGFVIHGSTVDPHGDAIDWKNLPDDEFNFRLRQEPGKMNSLGRLKFDFDNDFAVYMHGTPHQELFKKSERTLSSGCVRLRDPDRVAEILLAGTPGNWDAKHIEDAITAKKTRWVGLADPMPLYIVYWTVFGDGDSQINFRSDAYSYDDFLIKTLAGEALPESAFPQKDSVSP